MTKILKVFLRSLLLLIIIFVAVILSAFISNSVRYSKYSKTGVLKNGNFCISHICEGGGGWSHIYYVSDNSIITEIDEFGVSKSTSAQGTAFGKVYKPINSGKSDIFVAYSTFGGKPPEYFEVYHLYVDGNFNITYNVETIDKNQFIKNTGENL